MDHGSKDLRQFMIIVYVSSGVVTGSESKSGKVSGPDLQNTQTPFYPMNLLGFVLLSSLQLKVRIKSQELAQLI